MLSSERCATRCAEPALSDGSAARSSGSVAASTPASTSSLAATALRSEEPSTRPMMRSRSDLSEALMDAAEPELRARAASVSVPSRCMGPSVCFCPASSRRNLAVTPTRLDSLECMSDSAEPMAPWVMISPTKRSSALFTSCGLGSLPNLASWWSSSSSKSASFSSAERDFSGCSSDSSAAESACTACATTFSCSEPRPRSVDSKKTPPRSTSSTAPLTLLSRRPHMVAAIHICVPVLGSVSRSRNGARPWRRSTRSRSGRYCVRKNNSFAAFSAGFGEGVGTTSSSRMARSATSYSTAASKKISRKSRSVALGLTYAVGLSPEMPSTTSASPPATPPTRLLFSPSSAISSRSA
mmetsp:Transcript_30380/g.96937  ORF Transcript_30380/g.96937 Transcript_30380/m.96937 type:complete len:354 (+) Transcript_30380:3187-4248(+)